MNLKISSEAREAADKEVEQFRKWQDRTNQRGHFVQLAINAAVENHQRFIADAQKNYERVQNESAEKDREIERLKLLCADHATSQAIAESEVVQIGYKCAGMKEERDTITKQLAELREIAEGLAKCLKVWHDCRMMTPPKDGDVLTRYNQWKEKNEK